MKLNALNRYKLQEISFMILFWIISMVVYFLIMYYSTQGNWLRESFPKYVQFKYLFGLAVVIGVSIGGITGLLEKFAYTTIIRKLSFGKGIIIRTLVFLSVLILTAFFIGWSFYFSIGFGKEIAAVMSVKYFTTNAFIVILVYTAIISGVLNFVLQVNRSFGPGRIKNLLSGTYHHPKEEIRFFMFIDMIGSTSVSEQLGHIKFSQLLQDSFRDLSRIILRYNASVYQFIGDEAVLTWKLKAGLKDANCFRIFFEFKKILERNRSRYLKEYGVFPRFKSSVNMGKVTVAEVGEIKSELAFHGDVLNTASRVMDQCKVYGKDLLITKAVADVFKTYPKFEVTKIDKISLRGKANKVSIYEIKER